MLSILSCATVFCAKIFLDIFLGYGSFFNQHLTQRPLAALFYLSKVGFNLANQPGCIHISFGWRSDFQRGLHIFNHVLEHIDTVQDHIDNFAIRVLDHKTNKLELVLASGIPPEVQSLDMYASSEGNGISGYVAHRGRSYICPDVASDPRYLPGIAQAASSLTVPLRLHDQVIGVFIVESDRPGAFGEDDRQILEIFARYVAVSLHILELLVTFQYGSAFALGKTFSAQILMICLYCAAPMNMM